MKAYPYLIQGSNIVVVLDTNPYTISKTHITYEKVKEAIKAGKWDTIKEIIEPKKVVLNFGQGHVRIEGETFLWKGKEMHNALSSRRISMLKEGFSIDPMVAFMDRLSANPSKRSVTELYGFLERGNMPITPDGYFLAYKKVGNDYYDVHSHSVLNKPSDLMTDEDYASLSTKGFGKKKEVNVEVFNGVTTVWMERNEVNDDKDQTCSEGLHFCSEDYLQNFSGQRIVILKIDPADVVSIPSDYNDTKGRTSRYHVIGEVSMDATNDREFTKSVQSNANSALPKPAPRAPKTGSTKFYKGYSDGYADGSEQDDDGSEYDYNSSDYEEGYDKGMDDACNGTPARYVFVEPPKPVGPKTGTTPFYAGYSDGYEDLGYRYNVNYDDFDVKNSTDYNEGYSKGEDDRENDNAERYRYVD